MDHETLSVAAEQGLCVITFTRADKLNAWTYRLHAELRRAIESANADPEVDAIVVTATGKGFCAGADMSAVFGLSEAEKLRARAEADTQDWVALLRRSKPIVAAVNGAAVGIGVSLILPMDQIVASSEASFALRFVKMGLVPELAASHFVQRRMGFGAASRVLLTGDALTAPEALALSLIDQVTAPEALLDEAKALARRMGRNPHAALRATKQLLTDNAGETDLDRVQQRELDALAVAYASPEHKEAVAAFLAKRAPDFKAARG
ncbi:enoyl-CoA hydratase/isomerase family protein [Piscinibacter sp.]|uniref:enoyl-CoA hydratase/isomerase family protein n=1 Tax=Piscinibacter sp. TaxID=1903157 RepID=UPI0039E62987